MESGRFSDCCYKAVCTSKCDDSCIRYLEMKYLLDSSGIPKVCQRPIQLEAGSDYEAYCTLADIKGHIVDFVENGNNLYICSDFTGNGKTSWSIKLMLKFFDSIWAGNGFRTRALFVHVPTLLMQLKNFNNPLTSEYKQQLMDCDLVIWDDIAGTDVTQYDYGQLLSYIDYRLFANKSNIFTSNCTSADKFEKALGSKLVSRVWNTSQIVTFKGKDRRCSYGSYSDNF